MKFYKIINIRNLIAFMLLIYSTTNFAQSTYNNVLEFDAEYQISIEKNEYLLREPIILSFKILNYGDVGPKITMDLLTSFIITDYTGKKYQSGYHYAIDYNLVKPMSTMDVFEYDFDLEEYYAYYDGINRHTFPFGELTIKGVIIQPPYQPLYSNEIRINILEPTDDEKNALELLDEAYKNTDAKLYMQLVRNYPNSIYAPMALKENISISGISENKCKLFIERYSHSIFTDNVINDLSKLYIYGQRLDEGNQYYSSIVDTTKNTRLRKSIKNNINKLNKAFKQRNDKINQRVR